MRLLASSLLLLLLVGPAAAQKIARKDSPDDVPALLQRADAAFADKRYAAALKLLQLASEIAVAELERAVLAAMPPPPAGFTLKRPQSRRAAVAAAGLVAAVNVPIEWGCFKKGTQASLSIAVHRGGSMTEIVRMGIAMADRDPAVDKVVYEGGVTASLRRQGGGRLELHMIVAGNVVIVTAREVEAEQLLAAVDQKFVDGLQQVLEVN